jgi:hypothetical protein
VLAAETAVFVQLQLVRGVLLVLVGLIVALLALVTAQCDFYAHYGSSFKFASLLILAI